MNQVQIGNYTTDNGEDYSCVWYPEQKEATAWGPTFPYVSVGSGKCAFTGKAESIDEEKERGTVLEILILSKTQDEKMVRVVNHNFE